MDYTKYYPGGWKNLPLTSTPIWAAALDGFDQGIIDAWTAADAAQASADAALASAGGSIEIIPGTHTDGTTDDGTAINAALDALKNSGAPSNHLLIHGKSGDVCYINQIVQVTTDNCILDADVPVKFGPLGKIQLFGAVTEVPASGKPKLTADAPVGSTVLHLDNVSYFTAGDYCGMRGNRDSSGKPLQITFFTVTAVNTGALTLTITPPLDDTYLQTNPTTWTNKLSQVTRVQSSFMSVDATRGDLTIELDSSARCSVGDIVQVIDDTHTLDGDGTVQTGNFCHKEQAIIVDVPDSTHVTIDHALFHSYDHTANGRVQVLTALENTHVQNFDCTFTATPSGDDGTMNLFELRFGYKSSIRHCRAKGTGEGGASWLTQAFRLTDCYASSVESCAASSPSVVSIGGDGYGATFYGSTMCWIRNSFFSGCRHSVLWFNGASGCEAYACMSAGARISDYDWHGAECVDNTTVGCVAVGGIQATTDSDHRTAWKWGNPSHRPGDAGNRAVDCLVVNYQGVAIEGIPDCSENVWSGVVRGASIGIKLGPLTTPGDNTTIGTDGFVIRDSEFYDVAQPFDIDGGTNSVVTKLRVDNVTWTRCGDFALTNAPDARITGNKVIDHAGTGYVLTATGSPRLQVCDNDWSRAHAGVSLTGCANARVTDNRMFDLATTTVFHDGGANTGAAFIWNRFLGFTPATSGSGSTMTLDISNGLGGGGSGSYPGSYPIVFGDLDSTLQADITNAAGAYALPGGGIPKADMASAVQTSLTKADTAYQKPGGGIPDSDLATPGGADRSWDSAAEHSYNDWAYDVLEAENSTAPTAGVLALTRVRIRASGSRTHLVYSVATAASGLTSAYAVVYDAATGAELARTADISTTISSTGVKSMATVAGFTVTAGSDVYVGILQIGGTPAALYRAVTSGALGNAGLNSGTGYRFMAYGSSLTALPASPITPSSGTSSGNTFWCAIS